MRRKRIVPWLFGIVLSTVLASCSRSHKTDTGQSDDDAFNPRRWAPSADAIAAAKRERKAPMIVARSTQPRASDYDLNPNGASQPQPMGGEADRSSDQGSGDDAALGDMEKLPPPPMPKLGSGDEADQFGLPEWEQLARGELHIKRIRY